jgi:sulfite exporter TauE/SafE
MDVALFLSALMLGVAGAPHCAAMCGPASAALLRGCSQRKPHASPLAFHLARALGYATAGALAASSVGLLAQLGQL